VKDQKVTTFFQNFKPGQMESFMTAHF